MSTEYPEPTLEAPSVSVHIDNWHDMPTPKDPGDKTRHVSTRTWTDIGSIVEVLQLDPLRQKTEWFVSGVGTVFICHSQTQAQAALTGGGGNFGAQVICPGANVGSIHWTDFTQAKIWAVLTGASPVLSVIAERYAE